MKLFSVLTKSLLVTGLSFGLVLSASHAQSTADSADTTVYSISGHLPDLQFSLKTKGNKTVTQDDLKGKIVMTYFGYTHCPDICPTTMAELRVMKNSLPANVQKQTQLLFISVDPVRDTPNDLQNYVSAFDPTGIGATGTEEQIAEVARRYRVAYQIERPANAEDGKYEVMHAQGIYIFDQNGKARFLASNSHNGDLIKAKLVELAK